MYIHVHTCTYMYMMYSKSLYCVVCVNVYTVLCGDSSPPYGVSIMCVRFYIIRLNINGGFLVFNSSDSITVLHACQSIFNTY